MSWSAPKSLQQLAQSRQQQLWIRSLPEGYVMGTTTRTVLTSVQRGLRTKMVVADVAEIDGKEREKPAIIPRITYSNKHLPFISSAVDLPVWQKKVVAYIIDFGASTDNLFAANSHQDLGDVLRKRWLKAFPKHPTHIVVEGVTEVRADCQGRGPA